MIYAELARQHQLCPPLKGYLLVTAQNLTTMSVLTELAPVQQSMTFTVSTNIEM